MSLWECTGGMPAGNGGCRPTWDTVTVAGAGRKGIVRLTRGERLGGV